MAMLVSAAPVSAHDGDHGNSFFSAIVHVLSDPYHLLLAMMAGGAFWLLRRVMQRRDRR